MSKASNHSSGNPPGSSFGWLGWECGAPVVAVCGHSGSGKTTLLEAAIAELVAEGLLVAAIKHDAHGFQVDREGKDSDRFFRAGATVVLRGAGEQFERRGANSLLTLETTLGRLGSAHDVLLVEGHKDVALPKIWLCTQGESAPPPEVANVLLVLPWDGDRRAAFREFLREWLPVAWRARRLCGGLLIGGRSSRMGRPKQLLEFGGRTLGEIAATALCDGLRTASVALGAGELPATLTALPRLADAPGFSGPGAALIAAHRWAPGAAWIVAACDHPHLRAEHIEWLAAQRRPGVWAVVPRQADGHPSPMLALYEPQALELIERQGCMDSERDARPAQLLDSARTLVVTPPDALADGWKNVNTPEELDAERQRVAGNEKGN
jgi:molybdopterin-guanine dinucleotide biosynthesis protein MobB